MINERYAAYARAMRFHVDATRPRAPQEKGQVERLADRLGALIAAQVERVNDHPRPVLREPGAQLAQRLGR